MSRLILPPSSPLVQAEYRVEFWKSGAGVPWYLFFAKEHMDALLVVCVGVCVCFPSLLLLSTPHKLTSKFLV